MNIILGSAQIGLDYGVTNENGQPRNEIIYALLDTAYQNGIRKLDSAEYYGNANEKIGLYHRNSENKFDVINKIFRYPVKEQNLSEYKDRLIKGLQGLSIPNYDTLMVHDPSLLLSSQYYIDFLNSLKSEGIAKNLGVSVQSPTVIFDILDRVSLEVIQIPVNLFDQRALVSDVLSKLNALNIEVHARSIFLQGILLADITALPPYFSQYKSAFKQYETFRKKHDMNKLECALSFVASRHKIDNLVIGCQNAEELSEFFSFYSNLDGALLNKISYDALLQEEEGLINPVLWKI